MFSGMGVRRMRSCLIQSAKPFPWLRISFVAALILTLSGWTCTAIIGFQTCLGVSATPQITLLSPNAVSVTADSVVLISSSDSVSAAGIATPCPHRPASFHTICKWGRQSVEKTSTGERSHRDNSDRDGATCFDRRTGTIWDRRRSLIGNG